MPSIETLIHNISNENILTFFQNKIGSFKRDSQTFEDCNVDKDSFETPEKIGAAKLDGSEELLVFSCKCKNNLNQRSARKKQFDIAKRILTDDFTDGAIFIFYDSAGTFRFSFIRRNYGQTGDKRFTTWRRYTYLVSEKETNKTFIARIGGGDFSSLEKIQDAFSVAKLTKEFYEKLFSWYQWALSGEAGITYPNLVSPENEDNKQDATLEVQIIRLITRILFVWFIKQKDLVPATLFDENELGKILKDFNPNSNDSNYYNGILQNLFFATLNKKIEDRGFDKLKNNRDIKTKFRYEDEMFAISHKQILGLFHKIPFLNGGLVECLDKENKTHGEKEHLDGFSRNATTNKNGQFKHRAYIPNFIFFDEQKGLIPLLKNYNFTVEENAPNEIQVALDPELLGKVFENLLGAFNPETQTTARNSSGSFYTPREIVEYMTDESLLGFLKTSLPNQDEDLIKALVKNENLPKAFENDNSLKDKFATQLKKIKILDPACGSGAFPMGILRRMVEVLEKLKPEQDHYDLKLHLIEECIYGIDIQPIAAQISRLRFFISLVVDQDDIDFSKPEKNYGIATLPNLETKFVCANTLLGLTQEEDGLLDLSDNNIKKYKQELLDIRHQHFYAKSASAKKRLREQDEQKRDEIKQYLTKTATEPNQQKIEEAQQEISQLKKKRKDYEKEDWVDEIRHVNKELFPDGKAETSLFKKDLNAPRRNEIDNHIKHYQRIIDNENKKAQATGVEAQVQKLTDWNPYDQNQTADFFDTEWMFGLETGFDVVIGNPPYGATIGTRDKEYFKNNYRTAKTIRNVQKGSVDTYTLFIERAHGLCEINGNVSFIVPISITSSDALTGIHRLLEETCSIIKISSFAVRPKPIFQNATINTSILFFEKNNLNNEIILSTKLYRKNEDFNLEYLIRNLEFINVKKFKLRGRYPKISYKIEEKILEKIMNQPFKIKDLYQYNGKKIFYRAAGGRYFKIITNYATNSSAEKFIQLNNKYADAIGAILSSNLFFWFYQIISDNLNLKTYELESFGVPKLTDKNINEIEKMYSAYLEDIENNASIRTSTNNNSYKVSEFKEYKIVKSKHLIDKIDDLIFPFYGLSKDENDYIKTYDLTFRMSGE